MGWHGRMGRRHEKDGGVGEEVVKGAQEERAQRREQGESALGDEPGEMLREGGVGRVGLRSGQRGRQRRESDAW